MGLLSATRVTRQGGTRLPTTREDVLNTFESCVIMDGAYWMPIPDVSALNVRKALSMTYECLCRLKVRDILL